MRKLLGIIAVIALIVMGAYFLTRQTQPTKKYNGPVEKLTIGTVEGYPDLALIAKEKGYFKENGLDVTVKNYDKPSQIVNDLFASNIDLVSASSEFLVVRNSFEHNDLKIIAVTSKEDGKWEIIARKDKGVRNIADLKGKKIGLQRKTIGEFLLGRFLIYYGLSPADVQTADLMQSEYIPQIADGRLDAVVTLSPYTRKVKALLGENAISWSAQPDRSVYSISYTTGRFATGHQVAIERYLRSLVETEEFVKNHNSEARSIMQKQLGFNNADMNDLWQKFNFEISLPQELIITMEDEARWIIENKLTDKTEVPDYLSYIYFNALEAIKPESITITH